MSSIARESVCLCYRNQTNCRVSMCAWEGKLHIKYVIIWICINGPESNRTLSMYSNVNVVVILSGVHWLAALFSLDAKLHGQGREHCTLNIGNIRDACVATITTGFPLWTRISFVKINKVFLNQLLIYQYINLGHDFTQIE